MQPDDLQPVWPNLSVANFLPTLQTIQLWAQIVGKIRLAQTPWLNHSWHATLYVSARGLTTALIDHEAAAFDIEFDFISHELVIRATDGGLFKSPLAPKSVAAFYADVLKGLSALKIPVDIDTVPNELPDPLPFPQDHAIRIYDPLAAHLYWRALVQVQRVFHRFRTRFLGKNSPVHLFWGAFDLAVTRFSGRRAPLHPGGIPHLPDAVTRDAYSHEVSSAGFWPGGQGVNEPCFYAYAYPTPAAFAAASVLPAAAHFDPGLGEFLLPYESIRTAANPDKALLDFLQSTYEAAADLGGWDRAALECGEGRPGIPRPVGP